jgi:NADPH:quinone reductase-like Zn-dependent oxidoreductase
MRYAALNYRDLVVAQGGYGRQLQAPLIPLSDGAGEVVAVGPGVTRLRLGERVMSCFFQGWSAGRPTPHKRATSLGGPLDGTLAELVLLSAEGVCALPDGVDVRAAATLPCAAVTAWNALRVLAHVGPEDTVLVQGTGGVSLFALQLAKAMGATVIATSSREDKLARLTALGADHVIDYVRMPEWGKHARELTGGRGVDHVIEVGGAGTLAQSLRAMADGGTISLIGVLAGARHELHLPHVFLPQVRIQGVVVGSREDAEALLRVIAAHRIEPVIDDARFSLESARDAYEHLRAGAHFGKVVIALEG